MRVSSPRLGHQLARILSTNPVILFSQKNMLALLGRRRDSVSARAVIQQPPTILHHEIDSKSETETVPDDRTLVESRRLVALYDEVDLISLSDVPEDEVCSQTPCTTTSSGPFPSSSELHGKPERLSIIYPLPTAENLLTEEPTPPHTAADPLSIAPSLCIPCPLTPPPTHYKRRRARIISGEDHDPDPDQSSIRYVYVHLPPRGNTGVDHTTCRSNIDPDSAPRFPF
ncbi:hypothetical protein BGW80DRAFT_1266451 [Lactifluus volemus]|nr:hypothetical protein BGW80DRAFT_1266451 [Lactifluus volemus]